MRPGLPSLSSRIQHLPYGQPYGHCDQADKVGHKQHASDLLLVAAVFVDLHQDHDCRRGRALDNKKSRQKRIMRIQSGGVQNQYGGERQEDEFDDAHLHHILFDVLEADGDASQDAAENKERQGNRRISQQLDRTEDHIDEAFR